MSMEEARALGRAAERDLERYHEERRIARLHLQAAMWIAIPFAFALTLWGIRSGPSLSLHEGFLLIPVGFLLLLSIFTPIAWFAVGLWAWLRETTENLAWFMFGD